MTERVLYQFPVSHFCEKARWVLDHKGLAYRVHDQLPGPHVRTNRKLTGVSTVPVLIDAGQAIGGSHAIALHAESITDAHPLVPAEGAARAELEALVRYFDDTVGPAVRRFVYSLLIPRPELFRRVFFGGYGGLGALFGRVAGKGIRGVIGRMYGVGPGSAAASEEVVRAAADFVDARLASGTGMLLGSSFTLADLTVASLLGPVVGAAESPWPDSHGLAELEALRAALRARPVGQHVLRCYAEHRRA